MSSPKEKSKPKRASQKVQIVNESGLHARPAAEFVRTASMFRSDIWLLKGRERFSAISIVEVLTANLSQGDTAVIEAAGLDSDNAVAQLAGLISRLKG